MLISSLISYAQTPAYELKASTKDNSCVTFSSGGEYMAVASGNTVMFWYANSEKLSSTIETYMPLIHDMSYSPDNAHIAIVGTGRLNKNYTVEIIEVATQSMMGTIEAHTKEIFTISYSVDGTKLRTGSKDETAKIWDVGTGELLHTFEGNGYVLSTDFHPEGKYLALGGSNNTVSIYNAYSYELITSITQKDWVRTIKFNNSGSCLISAGHDGMVYFTDMESDFETKAYGEEEHWYYDIAFSGDDQYISLATDNNGIEIWNYENRLQFTKIKKAKGGTISSIAFHPEGELMASTSNLSSKVMVWDVSSYNIAPIFKFKDETDVTPPQIFVSSPANIVDNRVRYSQDLIKIRGSVIDESGVRRLRINGYNTPIKDNGSFLINLPLSMGENFVTMEATDINDNISLKKFVVQRRDLDGGDYSALEATNYLFVVGINNYEYWPKLNNAVQDANDVAGTLMAIYGFEFGNVTLIKDEQATRANIYKGLRGLIEKITPKDNLMIYFSGHGLYDELLNEGYWIPVDAKLNNHGEYLSNSDILKIIKNIDSQHTFLVADACFSGSLFNEQSRGYAENVEKFRSRWGLASGRLEAVSDGSQGENSPFAASFIGFLKNNSKDKITVSELVQHVKMEVAEVADQTPIGNPLKGSGDEGGEFVFYKKR